MNIWEIIQKLIGLSEKRFHLEQAKHTDTDPVWLCASDIQADPEEAAIDNQMLLLLHNTDYKTVRQIEAVMVCGMDIREHNDIENDISDLDALADYYQIPTLVNGGSIAGASEYIISKRHLFIFFRAYMDKISQKGKEVT